MRTILIVTEEEARAIEETRGRSKEAAAATMILTEEGRILKSANGWAGFTIDMEKLASVLNGEKRVVRAKKEQSK
jgi:hypothetical protein